MDVYEIAIREKVIFPFPAAKHQAIFSIGGINGDVYKIYGLLYHANIINSSTDLEKLKEIVHRPYYFMDPLKEYIKFLRSIRFNDDAIEKTYFIFTGNVVSTGSISSKYMTLLLLQFLKNKGVQFSICACIRDINFLLQAMQSSRNKYSFHSHMEGIDSDGLTNTFTKDFYKIIQDVYMPSLKVFDYVEHQRGKYIFTNYDCCYKQISNVAQKLQHSKLPHAGDLKYHHDLCDDVKRINYFFQKEIVAPFYSNLNWGMRVNERLEELGLNQFLQGEMIARAKNDSDKINTVKVVGLTTTLSLDSLNMYNQNIYLNAYEAGIANKDLIVFGKVY